MTGQRQFQLEMSQVLLGKADTSSRHPAFSIHRNTVAKALVDALAANYPTVLQLVGDEWFHACAREFAIAHPARSPALVRYGEKFPSFVAEFEPARELPYLSEVARIDRLWIECLTAADATTLTPTSLSGLQADELSNHRLALHPATRFGLFRHSAATIWIRHRTRAIDNGLDIDGTEEALLLTRAANEIQHAVLDRPAFDLLERLGSGETLGEAAVAILSVRPDVNLSSALAQLISAGAFAAATGECCEYSSA